MSLWHSVKKRLKKVPGLNDIISALESSAKFGLEVAESSVTQEWDASQLAQDGADVINATFAASDNVQAIAQMQAMMWVSMAVEMVLASANDGPLADIINSKIGQKIMEIKTYLQPAVDQVQKEQQRLHEIINNAQVQLAINSLKDAHRVGLIISPAYRSQVEKTFQYTREISREVFGDAAQIQAGLSLFQMLTYDLGSLTGEKVDVSNSKYFAGAADIVQQVADNSGSYSRNPEKFWYDLNANWLTPLQAERTAETERQRGIGQALADTLSTTVNGLTAFETRYNDYRKVVDPLLSEANLQWLDRMQRQFDNEYGRPFKALSTYISTRFPTIETTVDELDAAQTVTAARVGKVEQLTALPSSLNPQLRKAQGEHWASVLDNALVLPSISEQEKLQAQGQRIKGILEQIGDK